MAVLLVDHSVPQQPGQHHAHHRAAETTRTVAADLVHRAGEHLSPQVVLVEDPPRVVGHDELIHPSATMAYGCPLLAALQLAVRIAEPSEALVWLTYSTPDCVVGEETRLLLPAEKELSLGQLLMLQPWPGGLLAVSFTENDEDRRAFDALLAPLTRTGVAAGHRSVDARHEPSCRRTVDLLVDLVKVA